MLIQALEAAFAQFGPVEKAVVVSDAQTGTSRRLVSKAAASCPIFCLTDQLCD
jgi:uncharacterized protein YgbK (DUF1537 family)